MKIPLYAYAAIQHFYYDYEALKTSKSIAYEKLILRSFSYVIPFEVSSNII